METDHITHWIEYFLPKIRDTLSISDGDVQLLEKYKHVGAKNPITQAEVFNSYPKLVAKKRPKAAIVFGAADNLSSNVTELVEVLPSNDSLNNLLLLSADGATRFLLETEVYPDIMFTDLDGGVDLVIEAAEQGIVIFVLLHPDNVDLLDEFLGKGVNGNYVFCTQDRPTFGFVNTFGFTDGDRAVGFSILSGLKTLTLGFDLNGPIGTFSTHSKVQTDEFVLQKRLKLKIAEEILGYLSQFGSLYTIDPKFAPGSALKGESYESKLGCFLDLTESRKKGVNLGL